MNRQSTERADQIDTYKMGQIDADKATAIDVLSESIARAQAFRVYHGRQLRPSTLVRLGLADLITIN